MYTMVLFIVGVCRVMGLGAGGIVYFVRSWYQWIFSYRPIKRGKLYLYTMYTLYTDSIYSPARPRVAQGHIKDLCTSGYPP